jgi:Icc-related predicted phosphoesterase
MLCFLKIHAACNLQKTSVYLNIMDPKDTLNIIHLTDIHGALFLLDEIQRELANADLIVLSGDITHFGKNKEARTIIEKILHYNTSVFAVAGNCDYPEIEEYLAEMELNLHRMVKVIQNYAFAGIGGSLPCPGTTPFEYTDEQVSDWLKVISDEFSGENPLILVAHQPPYNTINDSLPNGMHVGSKALNQFIQDTQPLLCLTGHIHEGIGIDSIGVTKIVNPGPFRTGKFAKISISGKKSVNISIEQITASR